MRPLARRTMMKTAAALAATALTGECVSGTESPA